MTHIEAIAQSDRYNRNVKHLSAKVVRILPAHTDPITDGDNGWDVEVTVVDYGFSKEMIKAHTIS
jgi:hypothetical protein